MWFHRTDTLLQKCTSGSIRPVLWQNGISNINQIYILPTEFGGRDENKHRAWYGDKVLGAHVAKYTMTLFQDSIDRRVASNIASVALSNRFLRQNIPTILPGYDHKNELWTDRNAGTAVEAAVSYLSEAQNDDLAEWLVKEAIIHIIRDAK
mmetsp:Transcript_23899/g.50019  ORF Transcript_23899/g.50019 Transcript_23899/m.50019 type:complete len:151 (+) Transcript_23899:43-495(+)